MSNSILDQLNAEQRSAASTIEGPVLVLAGAGTGKTRVITFRIAYMLQQGIPPERILAMTFTNKAAREMKERISSMVAENVAKRVTVGTFHSFCSMILRRDITRLGFTANFTIADDSDQKGILKQAVGELGFTTENTPIDQLKWYIGDCKNNTVGPDQAIRFADTDHNIRMAHAYKRYQQILENQNMLDFDDMLFFVYRLFKEFPEVLEKYRERYEYLLVDEYQDTNTVQFRMIEMLAGERCNLCVVGDDDQSIYGWRGAIVENILDFPKKFKDVKEVRLEQNYRSTSKILDAANHVIANNTDRFDKKLWSAKGEGDNLKLVKTLSADAEAEFVSELIQQEVSTDPNRSYKDFAILYRSNHMSRILEQSLRHIGVPYRLVGGQEFFSRKEIKDAAAYLKLLVNPREDQSFLRIIGVPSRGIGDKAIKNLKELQQETHEPMSKLIGSEKYHEKISGKAKSSAQDFYHTLTKFRKIFEEPGDVAEKVLAYLQEVNYMNCFLKVYKSLRDAEIRQENVYEFINAIADYERKLDDSEEATLLGFLESYALFDDNDKTKEEEEHPDAVTLSTVHASKGLEFPYVFLVGLEFNLFPHERSIKENSIDEELRLFYVAITRAQQNLVISHAGSRMRYGQSKMQRPSPFLEYLPIDIVDKCEPDDLFIKMSTDDLHQGFANIFAMLNDDDE